MPIIANIYANFREPEIEHGVAQVARTKIIFLPKPRLHMGDVRLAILAQIVAVVVNDRRSVVVNAFRLHFIHWQDDRNMQFLRQLANQLRRRAVRHWLGKVIPARRLLRAEIWPVENFLQADNLRSSRGRLTDHAHMLVDHGLLDFFQRPLGRYDVSGLNQRTANDTRHRPSPDCSAKSILIGGMSMACLWPPLALAAVRQASAA